MEKLELFKKISDRGYAGGEFDTNGPTMEFRVKSPRPGTTYEENEFARRLCAAYNACEGIPTGLLEGLPLGFKEHSMEIERLKAVNKQLLEVLIDVKFRLELGDPEFNLPSLNAAISAATKTDPNQQTEPDYDNPAEREADQREADAPTPYDP